jgi:hypothetical protein
MSKERTQDNGVDPGLKFDKEKMRLDLVTPEMMFALGDVLTFGAVKYGDRNWEKGIKWSRVFGAMMRHAWAWMWSKKRDAETGLSHMDHAFTCAGFLVTFERRRMTNFDNRNVQD